jgi:Flp pilus assembly secretin CpaC
MRYVLFVLAVFGLTTVGNAQAYVPTPTQRDGKYLVDDVQCPPDLRCKIVPSPAAAIPAIPATPLEQRMAKIKHLVAAIEHLEAAGLNAEAKKVRETLDAELTAATAGVHALQVENQHLRDIVGDTEKIQVLLHVQLIEMSWSKLEAKDKQQFAELHAILAYARPRVILNGLPQSRAQSPALDSNHRLFKILERLRMDGIAKILSEPSIVTVNNHRAEIHLGGKFAYLNRQSNATFSTETVEWKDYGTQLSFLPVVQPDGKLRMQCSLTLSEIDEDHPIEINGIKLPRLKSRQITTEALMRFGQTLVAAGSMQETETPTPSTTSTPSKSEGKPAPETSEKRELLLLLTPELIDPNSFSNDPAPQPHLAKPKK